MKNKLYYGHARVQFSRMSPLLARVWVRNDFNSARLRADSRRNDGYQ